MIMVVEVLWLCWVGEVDGKKEEKSMAMMWSGKGKRENLALALAQLLPQGLHAQRRDVPCHAGGTVHSGITMHYISMDWTL